VRPIVKHTLSKELQLYYEKITKAIKGTNGALAFNLLCHREADSIFLSLSLSALHIEQEPARRWPRPH
jgi:hypothetical protein